jgi:hypothetical protein
MEEREPILSLIFYENDLVKSLNCYLLDDDLIEITSTYDSNVIGGVQLNSAQVKSLVETLKNVTGDSIEINDIEFKKSFIQNLETICE